MSTDATLAKSTPAPSITRAAAGSLITAVRAAAAEHGLEVAVAVTDVGGHLKAFERTDAAPFLSVDVAIDKAWTAASFRIPTHVWNDYVAIPQFAPLAHHPHLMAVGGGYPITENGNCIGGLGISGGTAEQDREVAAAALTALGFDLPD
ncbi:GlcG/HbpS family heme-binding protein [Nocardia sp. CA-129566]|uniref:GlcG/HbpS family heme-binding protein n=1 Tax=Nocardia sp. CA-129566 TaxID=3239976 RepID=UPI003D95AC9F